MAHLVDVTIAWDRAPLSLVERQRLLAYYGLGMAEERIARLFGVSQQAVNVSIRHGIGKLLDYLNGECDD